MSGPVPPEPLIARMGAPDMAEGHGQVSFLRSMGQLDPHEEVLEVGCGAGMAAIPLASFLSPQGAYEGIDLDAGSIAWCRRHVAALRPRFGFTHLDVYSGAYNEVGAIPPDEVSFPYEDERFDLAFGFSLFTHLLPGGLERYCAELERVTRKNGARMLATFFLLTDERRQMLETAVAADPGAGNGCARSILETFSGDHACGVQGAPEGMVVYREGFVREVLRGHGFRVSAPIAYGDWVEQAIGLGDRPQDILIAQKAADG